MNPPPGVVGRKLVRTAALTLQVENADNVLKQLEEIATSLGGFCGTSKLERSEDGSQSGSLSIRVPVTRFQEALEKVRALGKVEKMETDVQDVTGIHADLEARIRNAQREEAEILKLLERGGKLEEILQVETKLSEVRERIEQMQAQMRLLSDQTELSTLVLSIHEKGEAPVAELERYDARYQVRGAWRTLLGKLQGMLNFLIIVFIAGAVYWIPLLVLVWYICRQVKQALKRYAAPPRRAPTAAPEPAEEKEPEPDGEAEEDGTDPPGLPPSN